MIDAATGAVVVGAAQNQNNVAIQQPWQFIEIPDRRQLLHRDSGRVGPNPGHVEFVGFNDTNGTVTVSHAVRQRRRHVVSQLVRPQSRRPTRSASARPHGGRRALPGPEPAGQRAIQLSGPALSRLQSSTACRCATPVAGQEPDDHGPRRRQHVVLRARAESSTRPTLRSRASRRPAPTCRKTCRASSAPRRPRPMPRPWPP